MDSRTASDHLNRILSFFPRVDSKASILFGANSAMAGVLASRVGPSHIGVWQVSIPTGLTFAALFYSFACLYLCAYPNTKGGNSSNVYFKAIAGRSESSFVADFTQLGEDVWLRDLSAQIWRNSEILCLKYAYLKHALISTIFGLIPWMIAISATKF